MCIVIVEKKSIQVNTVVHCCQVQSIITQGAAVIGMHQSH